MKMKNRPTWSGEAGSLDYLNPAGELSERLKMRPKLLTFHRLLFYYNIPLLRKAARNLLRRPSLLIGGPWAFDLSYQGRAD